MTRKHLTLCLALVCACTILSSCKKDKDPNPVPASEIRLSGIEMKVQTNSYKYVLSYDAEGRISEVSHESNTEPSSVLFKVVYDGNHILLTRPMNDFDMSVADSIRLTLGIDGIVVSRIQNRFVQIWGSHNDETRTYINDSSYFDYNANGLVVKLTHNFKDSSWSSSSDKGPEMSTVIRKVELADYVIDANTLVSVYKRGDVSETTYINLDTTIVNTVEEATSTFDYTKAYANKIDFSNAAVLNELHAFTDMPLNKKHTYLPNKVQTIKTRKNKDGVVFSTTSVTAQSDFTFDADGLVLSKEDPANPGTKVTYSYKK